MKKILTGDILLMDLIAPLNEKTSPRHAGSAALPTLIKELGLRKDRKKVIDRIELEQLLKTIPKTSLEQYPGGSSANVMTTLRKLMGNEVDISFLGIVGDQYNAPILHSLADAGITLLPPPKSYENKKAETAVSVVLVGKDRKRMVATYRGNARELLDPGNVTEELVNAHDVVFLQGSLWEKFKPELADRLTKFRWKCGKELWLALPTHSKTGTQDFTHVRHMIHSANIVLANIGELARTYGVIDNEVEEDKITAAQTKKAAKKLQQDFNHAYHDKEAMPPPKTQVGFITLGDKGAMVVTAKKILYIPASPVAPEHIVNNLGAGDAAFAGFLAGQLKGLDAETSAHIGVSLAAEKLKEPGPRLSDPKKSRAAEMLGAPKDATRASR